MSIPGLIARAFLLVACSSAAVEVQIIHGPAPVASGWSVPQTEPRVAVHPEDPRHLLIAAILAPAANGDPWDCGVTSTRDGGHTWRSHAFGLDRCIDPWLVFNGDSLLFSAIEIARQGEGDQRLTLVLASSADGGKSWSGPRRAGGGYEHPMSLLHDGGFHLLSRQTRSTRNGQPRHEIELARVDAETLDYTIVHTLRPGNVQLTPTALVQHREQQLAFWYDYGRNLQGFGPDGQFEQSRAWVALASPDAATPAAEAVPRLIHDQCGGQINRQQLFAGYPFATSGAGWLHHLCIGAHLDGVLYSRSQMGESWTEPVRLDGTGPGRALTPMLAANDSGGVLAGWQDRRGDPDCQVMTLAASIDSGQSFGQPLALGDASCPNTDANGRAGRSWPGGSDYSSAATDANGQFHLAWAQMIDQRYHLMYAAIAIGPSP